MDGLWTALMHRLWRGTLDVLFPPRPLCPACQRPRRGGRGLCPECLVRIPKVAPPLCDRCGRPLRGDGPAADGLGDLCRACRWSPHMFSVARAPGVYDGALREYIHRVKFGADRALGEALGEFLAGYALRARELWPFDAVVPVPLHPQRLMERGFNQAEVLARVVASHAGRPLMTGVLERTRPTSAQARLPVHSRRANVRGAFRVREAERLAGKRLLLVDDVLTSGATAGEAARVLLRAGAARVNVLCLAVGVHEAEWRWRHRQLTPEPGIRRVSAEAHSITEADALEAGSDKEVRASDAFSP